MSHKNNGNCQGCLDKFNRYPGFSEFLQTWFFEKQFKTPTLHVANAGRGRAEQEEYFSRGASRAHFGESAHNWNCAVDTFFQIDGRYSVDRDLYLPVVQDLDMRVVWYGEKGAAFPETPHLEIANWRAMRDQGLLKLVE